MFLHVNLLCLNRRPWISLPTRPLTDIGDRVMERRFQKVPALAPEGPHALSGAFLFLAAALQADQPSKMPESTRI